MACYCISVMCEVFDCLALCFGCSQLRSRLWPGDASLAMKDLHNDAPRSQRVGIWPWRCRQARRLVVNGGLQQSWRSVLRWVYHRCYCPDLILEINEANMATAFELSPLKGRGGGGRRDRCRVSFLDGDGIVTEVAPYCPQTRRSCHYEMHAWACDKGTAAGAAERPLACRALPWRGAANEKGTEDD